MQEMQESPGNQKRDCKCEVKADFRSVEGAGLGDNLGDMARRGSRCVSSPRSHNSKEAMADEETFECHLDLAQGWVHGIREGLTPPPRQEALTDLKSDIRRPRKARYGRMQDVV